MEQTKRKASAVSAQASAVSSGAKGIAQAAERQLEALGKANDMFPSVTAATEEALAALRCLYVFYCAPPYLGRESSAYCAYSSLSSHLLYFSLSQVWSVATHMPSW